MAKRNISPANSEKRRDRDATDGARQPPSRLIPPLLPGPSANLFITAQIGPDMLQPDDSQYRLSKNHPTKVAGCATPRVTL